MQHQIQRHIRVVEQLGHAKSEQVRARITEELLRKRAKDPQSEAEINKCSKQSNQLTSRDLHDVFLGRIAPTLEAIGRERDRIA